jgi:hypothetical protein
MPPPDLESQANLLGNYCADNGDNTLHIAARSGATQLINVLSTQNPANLVARNHNNETPLHVAGASSQLQTFYALLKIHNQNCNKPDSQDYYDDETIKQAFTLLKKALFKNMNIKSLLNGLLGSICPSSGVLGYFQSTCFLIGKFAGVSMPFIVFNTVSGLVFVSCLGVFCYANHYVNRLETSNNLSTAEYNIILARLAGMNKKFQEMIPLRAEGVMPMQLTDDEELKLRKIYHDANMITIPPARTYSHLHENRQSYLCYKDRIAVTINLYLNNFLCSLTGLLLAFSLLVLPCFSGLSGTTDTITLKLLEYIVAILLAIVVLGLIYFTSHNEQLINLNNSIQENTQQQAQVVIKQQETVANMKAGLAENNIAIPVIPNPVMPSQGRSWGGLFNRFLREIEYMREGAALAVGASNPLLPK